MKVQSQVNYFDPEVIEQIREENRQRMREDVQRQIQANQVSLRDVVVEMDRGVGRDHGTMYEQYRRHIETYGGNPLTQDGALALLGLGFAGAYANYEPEPMTVLEVARHIESYVSQQGQGMQPQELRVRRNFEVKASVWVFVDALDMEKLTKELKRIYQLPIVECTEGERAGGQVELNVRLQTRGFREDFERQRVRPLPLNDGEVELYFS